MKLIPLLTLFCLLVRAEISGGQIGLYVPLTALLSLGIASCLQPGNEIIRRTFFLIFCGLFYFTGKPPVLVIETFQIHPDDLILGALLIIHAWNFRLDPMNFMTSQVVIRTLVPILLCMLILAVVFAKDGSALLSEYAATIISILRLFAMLYCCSMTFTNICSGPILLVLLMFARLGLFLL